MRINLPNKLKKETMYQLLNKAIDNDLKPKDLNIAFNFNTLNWIEPSGITVLSNLVEWLISQGVEVSFLIPDKVPAGRNCPVQYLEDSNFFAQHQLKVSEISNERPTTLVLQWVNSNNSYQWVDNNFAPWLSRQLGVNIQSLGTIKMCVLEILNNIRDHAKENLGCIFAQHYPANNSIKINISDFGVGIPNSIRTVRPYVLDDEALLLAIQEGFTAQSLPNNRGAGLHTLLENVVKNNNGTVCIHSNYGILNCIKGNNGDVYPESRLESRFYPGTFIEIELKTDLFHLIQDDFEEEFEW